MCAAARMAQHKYVYSNSLPTKRISLKRSPYSPSSTNQIILSTAHPAKFSEAVSTALKDITTPDYFDKHVLPKEFNGLLQKERRVIDVESADITLVKRVIEERV